jgi:chromosome segregation ATPase
MEAVSRVSPKRARNADRVDRAARHFEAKARALKSKLDETETHRGTERKRRKIAETALEKLKQEHTRLEKAFEIKNEHCERVIKDARESEKTALSQVDSLKGAVAELEQQCIEQQAQFEQAMAAERKSFQSALLDMMTQD